jgi:hypothetical protein
VGTLRLARIETGRPEMKGLIVLILAMAVVVVVVGAWAQPVLWPPAPRVIPQVNPPMCAGNPPLPSNCR